MEKVYIGVAGSGKTTELINDCSALMDKEDFENIIFIIDKSEKCLYEELCPEATIYTDADNINLDGCDLLVIDKIGDVSNIVLGESDRSILVTSQTFASLYNENEATKQRNEEIQKLDEASQETHNLHIFDFAGEDGVMCIKNWRDESVEEAQKTAKAIEETDEICQECWDPDCEGCSD